MSKTYVEVPCVLLSLIKETLTGDDVELTVQLSAESAANVLNIALSLINAWKGNHFSASTYKDSVLKLKLEDLEESLRAAGVFAAFNKKPLKEPYA